LAALPDSMARGDSRASEKFAPIWPEMLDMEKRLEDRFGCKPSVGTLLTLARHVATAHRLKLPLEAKRNAKFLLAWLVENWAVIGNDVMTGCVTPPPRPGPHVERPRPPPPHRPRIATTASHRRPPPPRQSALEPDSEESPSASFEDSPRELSAARDPTADPLAAAETDRAVTDSTGSF
jgi:hypothetical protein